MADFGLPSYPVPFVGREEELRQIIALLSDPACRLLTLLGTGGIGKTRLSIEAARLHQHTFEHSVHFVPLQPLPAPEFIIPAIAEAFHFQFTPGSDPKQQLLDFLSAKSLLLVLDNFEHLLEGAGIVSELLLASPSVKVLTTSRERLNLLEEWVLEVAGLSFPHNASDIPIEYYSAVQLFVENARRVRVGFTLDETRRTAITRICQLVGGMPLGIELASAWVRTLSCEDIAAEIERSLDILATSTRNVPERHRNMRAVLDYSWNLLTEIERQVFRQLSVFRGGFRKEAAQSVASASLQILSALVDKSLLRLSDNGRYELHELLRQFGEEKLQGSPDDFTRTRDHHSAYYVDFLSQREPDLKGRRQREALDEITAEFDNVRAAWDWMLRQNHPHAIAPALESLFLFCEMRGHYQEGKEHLQQAQAQLEPDSTKAGRLLWGRVSTRALWLSENPEHHAVVYEAVQSQLQAILAVAQEHDDRAQIGFCLWLLGVLNIVTQQYALGLTYIQRSLQVFSELNDRYYMARAADWLGAAYGYNGQPENLVKASQESLDMRRALGDQYGIAQALTNLAHGAAFEGHFVDAERYAQEMRAIYLEIGAWAGGVRGSGWLTFIAFLKGDFHQARAFAEETLEILRMNGSSFSEGGVALTILGMLAALEGDYARTRQLCERALRFPVGGGSAGLVEEGLAVAACGLEDYPTAAQNLVISLESRMEFFHIQGIVGLLPIAAIVLAHEGEKLQAVELLGMGFSRPASTRAWLEQWSLLKGLRAELEMELGLEAFAAAWEHGNMPALDQVVNGLIQRWRPREAALPSAALTANRSLDDPLSERELEVLHLMAAGASNQEIAEQLVIGMSTVKKHITHIFDKLSVESRTQALARARTLNLL